MANYDELDEELEEEKEKEDEAEQYIYNPADFSMFNNYARYTANEEKDAEISDTMNNVIDADFTTAGQNNEEEEEEQIQIQEPEVYEDKPAQESEEEVEIQRQEPEVYGDEEEADYNDPEGVPYPYTQEAQDQLELVESLADIKFQQFLAKEREEIQPVLDQMKSEHKDDYDEYVTKIRKSRYYKKRLKYWRKYYEDKRSEFKQEVAENLLKEVEAEAQKQAGELVETAAKKSPVKFEKEKVNKAKKDVEVKKEESGLRHGDKEVKESKPSSVKLNLVADKSLKKTIEQILLTHLHDAIDENRDFYSSERSAMEESKRIKPVWKEIVTTRAKFADSLVQSYSKTFDTTENKTAKVPYTPTIRAMQANIEAKKGNMDIASTADVVMDSIYHVDLKTKEATGIIPDLAEKLAIEVQEELVKNGQLDFNLCKEAASEMLNMISEKAKLAQSISMDNKRAVFLTTQQQRLIKLASAVQKSILNGEQTISEDEFDSYITALDLYKNNANLVEDNICDNLITCASIVKDALKSSKSSATEEEKSKYIEIIKEQKSYLKSGLNLQHIADIHTNDYFDKSNLSVKNTGTRSIIDKLLIDATKKVGASKSLNKLEEFEYTKTEANLETESLIKYFDKNGDLSVEVTSDLLTEMLYLVHDVRERVKNDAGKAEIAQDLLNDITFAIDYVDQYKGNELPEDMQLEISEIFKRFVEVSQFKEKGEKRLKVDLKKEESDKELTK